MILSTDREMADWCPSDSPGRMPMCVLARNIASSMPHDFSSLRRRAIIECLSCVPFECALYLRRTRLGRRCTSRSRTKILSDRVHLVYQLYFVQTHKIVAKLAQTMRMAQVAIARTLERSFCDHCARHVIHRSRERVDDDSRERVAAEDERSSRPRRWLGTGPVVFSHGTGATGEVAMLPEPSSSSDGFNPISYLFRSLILSLHMPRRYVALLPALVLFALSSCRAPAADALASLAMKTPADSIRFVGDTISLQENADVINVQPAVNVDPAGGFVVADMVESQIRLYDRHGSLKSRFGGKGSGPREFNGITTALRLPSQDIAVFDMVGKIAVFGADGTLKKTQATPFVPICDAVLLDPEHVAVAGRLNGQPVTKLVHIWNLTEGRIERSFFDVPAHPAALNAGYSYTGCANIAAHGDSIAIVFSLVDSVFLYKRDGTQIGSIPIPADGFRRLSQPMPEGRNVPVGEQQEWLRSFSTFADVYWLRDGTFLVQYFDLEGMEPAWSLVAITLDGRKRIETPSSKLLAVSPRDTLFFVHPHSVTPNRWSVAVLEPWRSR